MGKGRREKSLIRNMGVLSLGTFFPKLTALVVTPILTAQLTKAEYGEYDLITTVVSLLLPVVTLQISTAAFRFLIDKRDDREATAKIISNIYAFILPVSLAAVLLYAFLLRRTSLTDTVLVCIYFFSDILLIATQQIMRGLSRNMRYSMSAVVRSLVDLVLVVLLLSVGNFGLTGVLLAMTISTLAAWVFLFAGAKIGRYIDFRLVDRRMLGELLAYSWPMVPNNLSDWVLRLSDRMVITLFLGVEANAVYAVANKIPHVFGAVQNTFFYAWQENASLASKDEDKDAYYSGMCDGVFRIMLGLMAGLIAAAPLLFRLLIQGDYPDAYFQMPLLFMGMLFSCMASVLSGIYVAFRKTKSVGISTVTAAAVNLLIDLALVRTIGIWAGSVSTVAAYLVLLVYRMVDVQKFQRIHFRIPGMLLGVGLLAVMAVLSYQSSPVCDGINVVLFAAIVLIFDREILRSFFQKRR